jgi:hypothetical protein
MTSAHPRFRTHSRKRKNGEVVVYYFFDARGIWGMADIPLGRDYEKALAKWREIHDAVHAIIEATKPPPPVVEPKPPKPYPPEFNTRSALYRVWNAMHVRCYRPTHKSYRHYGGKGIAVCDAWRTYANFVPWALANGYLDGLSIDRIDNDRGYEPENCRWVELSMQSRHRRLTWKHRPREIRP